MIHVNRSALYSRCMRAPEYHLQAPLKLFSVLPDRRFGMARAQCSREYIGQALMGTSHIENRRLFEFASGRILLQDSEHEHVHTCTVCQGVLYVLLSQPTSNEIPSEPDAA